MFQGISKCIFCVIFDTDCEYTIQISLRKTTSIKPLEEERFSMAGTDLASVQINTFKLRTFLKCMFCVIIKYVYKYSSEKSLN